MSRLSHSEVHMVHRRLHIVADNAGAAAAGRHRKGIRVGQGYLLIR